MSVATTRTVSLRGMFGQLIDVQVDVSHGVVGTVISGRADTTLAEARDRVKMAVTNSGFKWPNDRRTTVLLSPAEVPKSGTHFDLAIAVGLLAVTGQLPDGRFHDAVFVAQLGLDGGLRCVPGVLPMALAATSQGFRRIFVAEPQAAEAALVPGLEVFGMRSLQQVVAELCGQEVPEAAPVAPMTAQSLLNWQGKSRGEHLDLADLDGVEDAKFALEVAAAGGHHLLLRGPKGTGKTSLAERLPGLLPDLEPQQSLELTVINSLSGTLSETGALLRRPPFAAPHHHASRTSLLGGGTGRVRPGEVSRAHHGVLFLDEFPLIAVDVIDALRQPLESGEVTIARGEEVATYPARGMVVLACNPCPCGAWTPDVTNDCRCSAVHRREYRRKLEGPLIDRIDIVREVRTPTGLGDAPTWEPVQTSAAVAERVLAARKRQADRYAGCDWRLNAHVPSSALDSRWQLEDDAAELLQEKTRGATVSRRGAVRASRVAWTLADLWEVERPGAREVRAALALRLGGTLEYADLRRAG